MGDFCHNACLVVCLGTQQCPWVAAALLPICLGQILCGLAASWQFVFWCMVESPWGPFAARSVAGGMARASSQWLHSRCPGRALGCRCCYQLMPEPCPGARLQLQTNSAQPHCSHRDWHPPQSHGVCAVTNPGNCPPVLGVPQLSTPCSSSRGMWFSLAVGETSPFNLWTSEKNTSCNSNKSFLSM